MISFAFLYGTRRRGTWRRLASTRSTVVVAALLAGVVVPVCASGAPVDSVDEHVEQHATPIDRMELHNPPPAGLVVVPPPETTAQRHPFLHDSKFSVQFRTYYFDREKYDNSESEAWAIGGAFKFTSGYVADF